MAWMNQERKAQIAKSLEQVMPKGWKYTLAVRHHSTLVLTIRQATVDLITELRASGMALPATAMYTQVTRYNLAGMPSWLFEKFTEIFDALNEGNHDNSDPSTDYFDVGWYVEVNIGQWKDPFLHVVEPSKWEKKAFKKGPHEKKLMRYEYEKYLPDDWKSLSPGKKAAATKEAMKKAGY